MKRIDPGPEGESRDGLCLLSASNLRLCGVDSRSWIGLDIEQGSWPLEWSEAGIEAYRRLEVSQKAFKWKAGQPLTISGKLEVPGQVRTNLGEVVVEGASWHWNHVFASPGPFSVWILEILEERGSRAERILESFTVVVKEGRQKWDRGDIRSPFSCSRLLEGIAGSNCLIGVNPDILMNGRASRGELSYGFEPGRGMDSAIRALANEVALRTPISFSPGDRSTGGGPSHPLQPGQNIVPVGPGEYQFELAAVTDPERALSKIRVEVSEYDPMAAPVPADEIEKGGTLTISGSDLEEEAPAGERRYRWKGSSETGGTLEVEAQELILVMSRFGIYRLLIEVQDSGGDTLSEVIHIAFDSPSEDDAESGPEGELLGGDTEVVPTLPGTYLFELVITDGSDRETRQKLEVGVARKEPGSTRDDEAIVGRQLSLSGAMLDDASLEGDRYRWIQQRGPSRGPLIDAGKSELSFVPEGPGVYEFEISVHESDGSVSSDRIVLVVESL